MQGRRAHGRTWQARFGDEPGNSSRCCSALWTCVLFACFDFQIWRQPILPSLCSCEFDSAVRQHVAISSLSFELIAAMAPTCDQVAASVTGGPPRLRVAGGRSTPSFCQLGADAQRALQRRGQYGTILTSRCAGPAVCVAMIFAAGRSSSDPPVDALHDTLTFHF
jgi:hypothetical protein